VTVQPLPVPHARAIRQEAAKIFVRGLTVEAQIGVYDSEQGRSQPLIFDVELDVAMGEPAKLSQTINYETIVQAAKDLAAAGHVALVETFAWRLSRALLDDPRVFRVRVRVEKPQALAPDAQAAGVEVVLARDPA
jgi:dihydroneopterin aldolase